MSTITLESQWLEILPKDATTAERRSRWAQWLRCARSYDRSLATGWMPEERCQGCANRRGGWCALQQLPCSVNPILTVQHSVPGMACMGLGREPKQMGLPL